MKDKIITIKPKGISQKQWVNFLLELNLMKKAWKPYGVDVEIKAPGLKKLYYGELKLADKYLNKVLTKFQVKIDEAANNWNRTKDPKYKDLWYKLVKEFANGPHNTKRRIVSISAINKGNDGTYVVIGKSRLFRPMRYRKVKINRV